MQFIWGTYLCQNCLKGTLPIKKYLFNFLKNYIYFGRGSVRAVVCMWRSEHFRESALSYSVGPKSHSGRQVWWHAPLPRVVPSVRRYSCRERKQPRSEQICPLDPTANLQGLEDAEKC